MIRRGLKRKVNFRAFLGTIEIFICGLSESMDGFSTPLELSTLEFLFVIVTGCQPLDLRDAEISQSDLGIAVGMIFSIFLKKDWGCMEDGNSGKDLGKLAKSLVNCIVQDTGSIFSMVNIGKAVDRLNENFVDFDEYVKDWALAKFVNSAFHGNKQGSKYLYPDLNAPSSILNQDNLIL
jgi:hypothetical protein